ncbi:MAG: hypothetical protein IIC91_06110 [Chloroflexi bacterium]|nr:hypothetical protein [Chloroflexota bacterium]
MLQCYDGPLQYFEVSIDPNASYNGQSAIAYVADGESSGSDETYFTTTRTFFNAVTFLPMGQVIEGTLDIGETYPIQADFVYEHEFVPLDSLADDFFDPASIGYVEPDPGDVEKPLNDAEIAVYWLGREFEGNGEYPALTLDSVFARLRSQSGEGGFVVELRYRPADDEFGYNWVSIRLYTPEAFEVRQENTRRNPCEETVELDLPGPRTTLRKHYHDLAQNPGEPCRPPDRISAAVYFDDVVVAIDAPATVSGRETFRSPYDSEAAMELLIRSLELRE